MAMRLSTKIGVSLLVLLASFGSGYYLEFRRVRQLQSQLESSESQTRVLQDKVDTLKTGLKLSELRDTASRMYLQVNQKNFGIALDLSTRYFATLRELIQATSDADLKQRLQELLKNHDDLTAALARGEETAVLLVQSQLVMTLENTRM